MRARAVIGANFGDEGKGLVTDFLCATDGADVVVRFNGGAQAGHTVVTPDGRRHVFGHFGSGSFVGVPTYLSEFFICNPIMFYSELEELEPFVPPPVYASPKCLVSTFVDMIVNQRKEDARGDKRHGSVGLGVHETIVRSEVPHLSITMADLWNGVNLEPILVELSTKYAQYRTGSSIEDYEPMIEKFIDGCELFAEDVAPLGIAQCKDPVFEGSQGLLLDMDNKEFFPHVTHSNTGLKNVRTLCAQAGIDKIDAYYVSRTYMTRHGVGPLPGENSSMSFKDETNVLHKYQGALRFAPLVAGWQNRCMEDSKGAVDGGYLVLTHCDQLEPVDQVDLYVNGPTREHVSTDYRRTKTG